MGTLPPVSTSALLSYEYSAKIMLVSAVVWFRTGTRCQCLTTTDLRHKFDEVAL